MAILKLNFKQFRRQYILLLSFIALLIGGIFFTIRGIAYSASLMMLLMVSQKLSIVTLIYFCFVGYEYQSSAARLNFQETVDTIQSARSRFFLHRLLLLILYVCILTLVLIGITALYGGSLLTKDFFVHIVLNNILNILLVGLLGAVLGSLLALNRGRVSAYILMLITFFIVSPFFEMLSFTLYQLKNINIYPYWDFFRILPFDLDWAPDSFYGLAIEASRWNIILFWISLFLIIFLIKINSMKKRSLQAVSLVFACILLINLYGYFQPGSEIRYDYRPDGASYGDHIYERDGGKEMDSYEIPADFSVSSYDMDLTVKRQLNAAVKMTVETVQGKNSYEFTLYRGYYITSVTDDSGKALKYTRSGNYFTINQPLGKKLATVNIDYTGSGNRYFSNYQGIALLGYAPYYPKPGHLQMWNDEENKFVANTNCSISDYTITVNSSRKVYSNLKGENNHFNGRTAGATLISGLIEPVSVSGINIIAPTADKFNEDEFIKFGDTWGWIFELLDLDKSFTIENKPILMTPIVSTRASGAENEVCVIMEDHVLLSSYNASENIYSLINSLIPYNKNKIYLKLCLTDYLSNKEAFFKYYESYLPKYDMLKYHIEHPIQEVNSEENYIQFNDSSMAMYNLMIYKMNTLGEEYTAKKIYDYLMDRTTTVDEVDFLYNLQ